MEQLFVPCKGTLVDIFLAFDKEKNKMLECTTEGRGVNPVLGGFAGRHQPAARGDEYLAVAGRRESC